MRNVLSAFFSALLVLAPLTVWAQSDDEGVQMTGWSVPALRRSSPAPDDTFSPFANTTWPLTVT